MHPYYRLAQLVNVIETAEGNQKWRKWKWNPTEEFQWWLTLWIRCHVLAALTSFVSWVGSALHGGITASLNQNEMHNSVTRLIAMEWFYDSKYSIPFIHSMGTSLVCCVLCVRVCVSVWCVNDVGDICPSVWLKLYYSPEMELHSRCQTTYQLVFHCVIVCHRARRIPPTCWPTLSLWMEFTNG